ncbi:MAG: AAA family ATPase [Patescibacteria group bacterium]
MTKIILGFVGEIASGKGTACAYITKKYSAGTHRYSTILRDVLDRLYIEKSRENMQKVSLILRENLSQEIFARVIAEDVKNDPAEIVCVDGIRRLPDIAHLQQLPNFYLINIIADEKTRYKRIVLRSENSDDKNKTFTQFQKDHEAETEQTIRQIASHSTITLDNNGTREDLEKNIDALIEKLKQN